MTRAFKQKTGILAALAAGVILMSAAHPGPKDGDHKFTNLKVLPKDITYEELDKVMDHFSPSLGVRCGYCHAPSKTSKGLDFASDEKQEKEIARSMMKMTHSINTDYFNYMKSSQPDTIHAVTCFTCHRGNTEPLTIPPPREKHMPPPPPLGDKH